MAGRTIAGQLSLVNVIEGMAAAAGGRRRVLHPGLVTGRAIDFGVGLEERKTRCGMIEARRGPAGRIVAARAIRPQPALVRVVGRVAGRATGREIVPVIGPRMTIRALEPRMTVPKCKARDARVIESGTLPAIGRVAFAAVRSALTLVDVVHRVTACAGRRRLVKTIALVTISASDLVVRSGQRIARKRVVENRVLPGGLGMAGAAGGAELPLVDVIILVTARARGCGIAHRRPGRMTSVAGRADVRTLQGKVRHFVVEESGVQFDDVGIPALVFGVADRAVTLPRCVEKPVKAGAVDPVAAYAFVAGHT